MRGDFYVRKDDNGRTLEESGRLSPMRWQPITNQHIGIVGVNTGEYEPRQAWRDSVGLWTASGGGVLTPQPTHWMPLPPSPRDHGGANFSFDDEHKARLAAESRLTEAEQQREQDKAEIERLLGVISALGVNLRSVMARAEGYQTMKMDLEDEREHRRAADARAEEATSQLEKVNARRFPIMHGLSIPWSLIAPHEHQAQSNHSQSLARLAERGGLSPCEAVAILEDREWYSMDDKVSIARLQQIANSDVYAQLASATRTHQALVEALKRIAELIQSRYPALCIGFDPKVSLLGDYIDRCKTCGHPEVPHIVAALIAADTLQENK